LSGWIDGMVDLSFDELSLAFEFVGSAPPGENNAYVCLDTGRIFWTSECGLRDEDVPDDLDASDRYVLVPHKTELDLGRKLALRFVASALPESYDQVVSFFRKRGAYARLKRLLESNGALERWYEYEAEAIEKGLREWCADNGIALAQTAAAVLTQPADQSHRGTP
jgi:hypothetical protein